MSLLITGIIDGPLPGGLPKAIELTVLADIPDLSIYGLGSANNGGGTDGQEFIFPTVAATAGARIYIASESTEFTNFFGFAPDYTSSSASINGDDAVELFQSGSVIDLFGDINASGTGQSWDYRDGWAYRNSGVTAPSATFDSAEWTFSGPDALDGEGSNATAATAFPIGTFTPDGVGTGATFSIAPADAEKAEGDIGTTDFTFTVTRSGDTDGPASVDFSVSASDVEAADFGGTLPSGTVEFEDGQTNATITIGVTGDEIIEDDEDFTVSLSNPVGGTISIATADGRIINDDLSISLISQIQGNAATWGEQFGRTDATPFFGATVKVSAIVVGDFQNGDGDATRDLQGFYLQEEDVDADADPTTSEGIYIYEGSSFLTDVNIGDKVTVIGTATEFFGETEIIATQVIVESTGNAAPTAAAITFPIAGVQTNVDGQIIADLEAYEGMSVSIPQAMTVADLFDYGRYGEVGLYADGRLETYTQSNAPDVAGFQSYVEDAVRNTITLNDGLTSQNPAILPYPNGLFDAGAGLSSGDTVTDITGVVRYSRGSGGSGDENYRINPTEAPTFIDTNPRELAPPDVGGSLKVASYNVLNYFNGDGQGGGFPTSRGADSAAEFARQQEKLVAAISALDADVVGLIEIENDGYGPDSAIQSLVDALNAEMGSGTYEFVDPGVPQIGGDAIAVGFIYKPGSVRLVGQSAILDNTVDPRFDSDNQRPSLAQSFEEIVTGETFTSVVNHFKSKGSPVAGTSGDEDAGDGAGNANTTRTQAAEALADWIATDPTGVGDSDVLVIGDLNAYAAEDPIQALLDGADDTRGTGDDLTNLTDDAYSYGFPVDLATAGQVQSFGTLDYSLSSNSLTAQVTGAEVWHINTDEPGYIDYNTEFKPENPDIYAPDPFRSSDHDPVVIGLELAPATMLARLDFVEARGRDKAVYSLDGEEISTDRLRSLSRDIEFDAAGIEIGADDGWGFSPEFVSTLGEGLGVFSVFGDFFFRRSERETVDDRETLSFDLAAADGLGDALEVGFEFGFTKGRGKVELTFFDDGEQVDSVQLGIDDGSIAYQLERGTDFDRVELGTTRSLDVSISAVEFLRIEEDNNLIG